jgi:hypothetical protein
MSLGIGTPEVMFLLGPVMGLVGTVLLWRNGARRAGLIAICGAAFLIPSYYNAAYAAAWLRQVLAHADQQSVFVVAQVYYWSLAFAAWGLFLLVAAFWFRVQLHSAN